MSSTEIAVALLVICVSSVMAAGACAFMAFWFTRSRASDSPLQEITKGSDTIGGGSIATPAQVKSVVTLAIRSSSECANKIRALGVTGLRKTDFADAMEPLSLDDRAKVVNNMMEMKNSSKAVVNFGLAAIAYLLEAPAAVRRGTTVKCAAGYEPCSATKFNSGFEQGADKAFAKEGIPSNRICCKFANASGDPRPSCKESVKKAQNKYNKIFMIVGLVIAVIGAVAGVAAAAVAPVGSAVAVTSGTFVFDTLGASVFIGGTVAGEVFSGIQTKVVDTMINKAQPMRSCCKDDFFSGEPQNSIIVKKYTDESGAQQLGSWQTKNGCPVMWGTPETVEYADLLGSAMSKEYGAMSENEPSFPNAGKKDCTQGCVKIITPNEWLLSGKKKIGCYTTCPTQSTAHQDITRGRCNFTCDVSGRTTNHSYWRNAA